MAELGRATRDGLIAGDYPLKTEAIIITGPADFKRGDVVGRTIGGAFALTDSAQSNGLQNPIGIISDDVVVETGETATAVIYVKGEFSERFLQFGGTDTADTHRRHMTEIGLMIRETKV